MATSKSFKRWKSRGAGKENRISFGFPAAVLTQGMAYYYTCSALHLYIGVAETFTSESPKSFGNFFRAPRRQLSQASPIGVCMNPVARGACIGSMPGETRDLGRSSNAAMSPITPLHRY